MPSWKTTVTTTTTTTNPEGHSVEETKTKTYSYPHDTSGSSTDSRGWKSVAWDLDYDRPLPPRRKR